MKIEREYFVIAFFLLALVQTNSAWLNINPVYSHIKNFAIVYYAMPDSEALWAGQHLDLMIGGFNTISKSVNPDLIFFKYVTCQTIDPTGAQAGWWQGCLANSSLNCEDAFFHMKQDVTGYNAGGTAGIVNINGWDPANDRNGDGYVDDAEFASRANTLASARRRSESRIPAWRITQFLSNFNQSFYQNWCVADATGSFATGTGNYEYEGIMNDMIDTDIIVSNGIVSEFDPNPETRKMQYQAMTTAYLRNICTAARAKGKICSINLAGGRDNYADVIDMHLKEFFFTYKQELAYYVANSTYPCSGSVCYHYPYNSDNYYLMRMAQRNEQYGTSELFQFEGNDYPRWPCNLTDDSIPRDKEYFLSLYYQMANQYSMFSWFPASAQGWYGKPPSETWVPAAEVDIGQPEGPFGVITGTNTNYNPPDSNYPYSGYYQMFVRNFTKGRVYVLPRPSYASCIGNTTFNHINLGGVFRRVNYDGSLSDPITSIDLRWKEGAILLKDAYAPNNAPKVNSVQCNIDGSWQSCTSAIYGKTISSIRANCTDNTGVAKANFTLKNVPDSKTLFSQLGTLSGGYYYVNNINYQIQDSGDFILNTECTDIDGATTSNLDQWTVPWGTLTVTQNSPQSNGNVSGQFSYSATITCTGGECGDITSTLDPTARFDTGSNSADAFIYTVDPNANSNSGGFKGYMYFSYSYSREPLVRFNNIIGTNANQIPPRARIQSAKVYLYQTALSASYISIPISVSIYGLLRPWTEYGVTYNKYDGVNSWQTAGASGTLDRDQIADSQVTVSGADSTRYVSFDVTRTLQKIANGEMQNNGWILKAANDGGGSAPYFLGKLTSLGSQLPYLEVTYQPYGYKGIVPMGSGTPFYTTNQNPIAKTQLACLSGMKSGSACTTTWNVVPTGAQGTEWSFFVDYASNYPAVSMQSPILLIKIASNTNFPSPSPSASPSASPSTNPSASPSASPSTTPCTENWSCTTWGSCSNGNQTRACLDVNSCGTSTNKPAEIQACPIPSINPSVSPSASIGPCAENWSCTDWATCIASMQTRICQDGNNCGTTNSKPAESQSCTMPSNPPGSSGPSGPGSSSSSNVGPQGTPRPSAKISPTPTLTPKEFSQTVIDIEQQLPDISFDQQSQKDVEEMLAQAKELERQGNRERALILLNQAKKKLNDTVSKSKEKKADFTWQIAMILVIIVMAIALYYIKRKHLGTVKLEKETIAKTWDETTK